MMFKIIKGKAPNYLTMLFSNCNNINYQLRSCNNLKISLPKTDFLKKSFAYRGAASWNKLLRHLMSVSLVIFFEYFLINIFILKFNNYML